VKHGDYYQEYVYAIAIKKMSKLQFKIKIILKSKVHKMQKKMFFILWDESSCDELTVCRMNRPC